MANSLLFDIIARDKASEVFKAVSSSADETGSKLHNFASKTSGVLLATGGAATAAGAVLLEMGEKVERSHKELEVAIGNTGAKYEEFAGQVDKAVSHQEKFGHSSSDTQEALAVLTRATGNTSQSLKDMALVTELAAAHHTSLAEAANTVAKMHAGAFKPLKEFGINIKDNASAVKELTAAQKDVVAADTASADASSRLADLHTILAGKKKLTASETIQLRKATDADTEAAARSDAAHQRLAAAQASGAKAMDFATASALVMAKVHGTAEAQADTFGGKILALKTHLEDMAASIGTKVGPALTIAGPLLAGLGGIVEATTTPAFVSMASAVFGAVLPFVAIAAAIAALTVGVIYAYNHFQVFHDVVDAVASWLRDTALPFVEAFAGGVVAAFSDVVSWVQENWSKVQAVISFVITAVRMYIEAELAVIKFIWSAVGADLLRIASAIWDAIKTYVTTAITVISDVIAFVMAVISGDWGAAWTAIKQAVSDAWAGIKQLMTDALVVVQGILSAGASLLLTAGKDLIGGLWAGIKWAWAAGLSFFTDLPANAVSAVGDLGSGLFNLGKKIVGEIVKGITSSGGSIAGAIVDAIPGGSTVGGAISHLLGRARGGPVLAGVPYMVGEYRPEVFVPDRNGTILPRVPTGGGDTYITNVNGVFPNAVEAGTAASLAMRMRR